jgi:hypothetical protein
VSGRPTPPPQIQHRFTALEIRVLLRALMRSLALRAVDMLEQSEDIPNERYITQQLLERLTLKQPAHQPHDGRQGQERADQPDNNRTPHGASLMRLDDDDYQLSRRISRRPRDSDGEDPLRGLLVHRLTVTMKGVARRPLAEPRTPRLFCEDCDKWFRLGSFPEVTQCPGCGNVYRMEFAVYEQIEEGDLDG